MPYEPYAVVLKRLLKDLRDDRAAFLIGAGVSMVEPSSLPSGHALKNACVEALRIGEPGLSKYIARLGRDKRYSEAVPELIFQRFFEVLQVRFQQFFMHLRLSDQNQGHSILGITAARGTPILTTNFDDLIERTTASSRGVLHLHGHLGKPEEMVVRINQVGRGLRRGLQASMLKAIDGRALYVLGYSGADADIMRVLTRANLDRVAWFARQPVGRTLRHNVSKLVHHQDCSIVVTDLRRLFRDLARRYGISRSRTPDRHCGRTRHVREWALKLSSVERWTCVSVVFALLERYEEACDLCLKARRYADSRFPEAWFLNDAADYMKTAGRFAQARRYAQRALRLNRYPVDWPVKAGSLNLLGLVHLEKERPERKRATRYFLRAERAIKRYRPTPTSRVTADARDGFVSRVYNNLGLAAGNPKDALGYYETSLGIKRQRGDVIGLCVTAMNACIAAYEMRDYRRSYRWKRSALAIATRYDRLFEQAYLFRELGRISCEQGRRKHGLSMLERARDIYASNATLKYGLALTEQIIQSLS